MSRTDEVIEELTPFDMVDSLMDDLLSATLDELVDLFNAELTIEELVDLFTDESAELEAEEDNPCVVEYLLLEYSRTFWDVDDGAGSTTVDLACELYDE